MAVRTAYAPVAGTAITAANHAKFPGGWIGYVEVTADQGSITTIVDLTSLTLTVTCGTSRKVRVTGDCGFYSSVTGDLPGLRITDGSNNIQQARNIYSPTNSTAMACHAEWASNPSTGSNTWKLRGLRTAGTGNVVMTAAADAPAFILVEDLGPSA